MPIPIIDLFAGPGGLAEGFSSLADNNGNRIFDIKLSIEKDPFAHQTLTLRSFVRQFPLGKLPEEYYQFLKGEIKLEALYNLYPAEQTEAAEEAMLATLGETPVDEIDNKIRLGLNNNRNWVLIGGPPCQAYSLAGRSRVGGIHEDDLRVDLYKEYLRIIACHQPAVFVMENVKGLLSAELNDEKIFPKILRDLQDPSSVFPEYESAAYRIVSLVKSTVRKDNDYLIKAEEYGVPQKRHRVILLGLRNDIIRVPDTLSVSTKVVLKSVIGDLPAVRSGIYREFSHSENVIVKGKPKKKRHYTPLKDTYDGWLQYINRYSKELLSTLKELGHPVALNVKYPYSTGKAFLIYNEETINKEHPLFGWYHDPKIKGIVQHISRSHLVQDLKRYLFASLYTNIFNKFPRMEDYRKFGEDLIPDHDNAESGKFNDRFRVQLPDEPATTVTSHISKDGHYFIHYDPVQCRSLTVREAARIQTFPDNYYFCGSRTQQLHQVGNAVPPYLAFQISRIVRDLLIIPDEIN
jgi:DNA (cytosine-5)-methyltransferase 1